MEQTLFLNNLFCEAVALFYKKKPPFSKIRVKGKGYITENIIKGAIFSELMIYFTGPQIAEMAKCDVLHVYNMCKLKKQAPIEILNLVKKKIKEHESSIDS